MQARQIDEQEYELLQHKYINNPTGLTNDEYQSKRRFELEGKDLSDEMQKYYDWLTGKRRPKPGDRYKWHKKAQEVIQKLYPDYKLYEIGNWTRNFSTTAIQRLYSGVFNSVSKEYAKNIYHNLRTETKKRGIQYDYQK